MKPTARYLLLGLLTAVLAVSSRADIIVFPGIIPQSDGENVLLNTGLTGSTITGTLNQSGFLVDFNSTGGLLTAPADGQARIEGGTGNNPFSQLTFGLQGGGTFLGAIFNIDATTNGIFALSVTEPNGEITTFSFALSGFGQNFFTVLAINDQQISSISLTSTDTTFADVAQVTISGAAGGMSVPDGGSTAILLGASLTGLGIVGRGCRAVSRASRASQSV